ncbi:GPO family capsid scaffolding protein [Aliivibrio fischeri]|uniref:GPO family capsid scaffolding protein n=1 Tax=Aliivibrio fischeri TaxID=668 RepID=UPI003F76B58C
MSKQSGWKIAATEGATIDGRTITKQWIEDMADQYSMAEYGALIWPEHSRSRWDKFEGKNWGTVDEVKSEKRAGKYRLLVKVTPNKYLLAANADGQKLFMSIEPDPDYCGSGRCYLMGLAVTDSHQQVQHFLSFQKKTEKKTAMNTAN